MSRNVIFFQHILYCQTAKFVLRFLLVSRKMENSLTDFHFCCVTMYKDFNLKKCNKYMKTKSQKPDSNKTVTQAHTHK